MLRDEEYLKIQRKHKDLKSYKNKAPSIEVRDEITKELLRLRDEWEFEDNIVSLGNIQFTMDDIGNRFGFYVQAALVDHEAKEILSLSFLGSKAGDQLFKEFQGLRPEIKETQKSLEALRAMKTKNEELKDQVI